MRDDRAARGAVVELDEVAAIVRCRGCTHTLVTVLRGSERGRVSCSARSASSHRPDLTARPAASVTAISTGTQPIVVRNTVSREMVSPTP